MNWRRFFLDTGASLLMVELFVLFECLRHVSHVLPVAIAGVVTSPLVAFAAQRLKIRGSAEGGWLFVLIFFAELYLLAFGITDFSWSEIERSAVSRFNYAWPILTMDGDRFKDVYVVLASAAFTLFAIFFIAVRKINAISATRLVAISGVFGSVFLLAVSPMLLRDEGWWRLTMMIFLNSTALVALARQPSPYVVDYLNDSLIIGQFWNSWLSIRTGWAMIGLVGLVIMPVFPVAGELFYVLTLLYNLWVAAYGATFLFVSTETTKAKQRDQLLQQLYAIRPTAFLTGLFKSMEPYRAPNRRPINAVPFVLSNLPPLPPTPPTPRQDPHG